MSKVVMNIPVDLMTEILKRMRKLQSLANKTEANLSLIKSRPITKVEANDFFSAFLRMYSYVSDIESSFFDFWHEIHIKQINEDIRFNEEDVAAVSSLLTQIR